MNMNNDPKIEELQQMIKECDDKAGHHMLWVDRNGIVRLTRLEKETPAIWAGRMSAKILFRYESFAVGNGYMGEAASQDEDFVRKLFSWLKDEWEAHDKGK